MVINMKLYILLAPHSLHLSSILLMDIHRNVSCDYRKFHVLAFNFLFLINSQFYVVFNECLHGACDAG